MSRALDTDLAARRPPRPLAPPEEAPVAVEDEARIRAAQAGDPSATAEVLTALVPRVRNLVRYLVRGDADVDDITQDALAAVLRGLPTFRFECPLPAWADRIVAREAIGAARRRRSLLARATAWARDAGVIEGGTAPFADEYLARRQVARAVDRLTATQREVIVLHYALGMSVPEIAAEVGSPVETVRSRLRLGRTRLEELLGEAGSSDRRPS